MADARSFVTVDGPFAMRHGRLSRPRIAYETWGRLSDQRDNAVLIFTGLSPSAHVCSSTSDPSPGWWEDMVGPGRSIDTDHYFVVCVNSLGSCFGSTGPASVNPDTEQRYRLTFPVLTIEDIAEGGRLVIDALDIKVLHSVVGSSMGGMTAVAFAVMYPERVLHLISISAASASLPFTIALRSLQREIIRKDPAWQEGNYSPDEQPVVGMRLARKLGMITYRSGEEWEQRFGRKKIKQNYDPSEPFGMNFEVEAYLEATSRKFVGGFDANCYLYLSRSMDLFDLTEHGGSVVAACERLQIRSALVLGVVTDFLFPVRQQWELAEALDRTGVHVTYKELASLQGHDSFLIDMERFAPAVAEFYHASHAAA